MSHSGLEYKIDNNKLKNLKDALVNAGIEYMITRQDGVVIHFNAWVGEDNCLGEQ